MFFLCPPHFLFMNHFHPILLPLLDFLQFLLILCSELVPDPSNPSSLSHTSFASVPPPASSFPASSMRPSLSTYVLFFLSPFFICSSSDSSSSLLLFLFSIFIFSPVFPPHSSEPRATDLRRWMNSLLSPWRQLSKYDLHCEADALLCEAFALICHRSCQCCAPVSTSVRLSLSVACYFSLRRCCAVNKAAIVSWPDVTVRRTRLRDLVPIATIIST